MAAVMYVKITGSVLFAPTPDPNTNYFRTLERNEPVLCLGTSPEMGEGYMRVLASDGLIGEVLSTALSTERQP